MKRGEELFKIVEYTFNFFSGKIHTHFPSYSPSFFFLSHPQTFLWGRVKRWEGWLTSLPPIFESLQSLESNEQFLMSMDDVSSTSLLRNPHNGRVCQDRVRKSCDFVTCRPSLWPDDGRRHSSVFKHPKESAIKTAGNPFSFFLTFFSNTLFQAKN